MSVSTHIKFTPQTDAGLRAGRRAHAVRGFFDNALRWRCARFCHVRRSGYACTHPVGAGSYVSERSRAALSAGVDDKAARDPHHTTPRGGCFMGDGGRVALRISGCGDWRGLGGTTCARFYRDQTAGDPGRGQPSALLADPPGGRARFKCGAKPLAHRLAAITAASARSTGPRRSALAGGIVPITAGASRNMGGEL